MYGLDGDLSVGVDRSTTLSFRGGDEEIVVGVSNAASP